MNDTGGYIVPQGDIQEVYKVLINAYKNPINNSFNSEENSEEFAISQYLKLYNKNKGRIIMDYINTKWALMITSDNFPLEDAGALRDECFASIYQHAGYRVFVICKNRKSKSGTYKDIEYLSVFNAGKGLINKVLQQYRISKIIKYEMHRLSSLGSLELVHICDAPVGVMGFVKQYCKKKHIKLFYDCVEWYSPCEFARGRFDKAYIINNLFNRILVDKQFYVYSISSFLERYFSNKGIKTVRIPVILNAEDNSEVTEQPSERKQIVYAGSPGKKDSLELIIKSFFGLDETIKSKLFLHVVGVSEETLVNAGICSDEQLKLNDNYCRVYGRVPHESVINILQHCDLAVLIRPANKRFAKAGFPTKVVEAMINSVAMICNISSDLGMYLEDGRNAIIVNSDERSNIQNAFIRAANMTRNQVEELKRNAKNTAKLEFDYRKYVEVVEGFIRG